METLLAMGKLLLFWLIGVTLLQIAQAEYLGCYKENKKDRNFRISPGGYTPSVVTPNDCSRACSAIKYTTHVAIVQGKYCFCANDLALTEIDASKCTRNCIDGSECGGIDYVSVYKIGGYINSLSLDVSQIIVPVKQSVSLTISIDSELQVDYQFDYGDGAGLTEKNGTDIYTKSFENPGEYEVVVLATDSGGSGMEMQAKCAVLVDEPVGSVDFLCPQSGVTFNEIECNATVTAGTSMEASVSFGDGTASNFTIADPAKFYAGPGIPDKGIAVAGDVGTFIMPASEFKEDGTLTAFEFHASGTGSITFLILRPSCAPGCYSYKDNSCQPSGCDGATLFQCTTAEFCPSSGLCSDSCTKVVRYSATTPNVPGYDVVASIQHTIASLNHNFIPNADGVVVLKGDILGCVVTVGVELSAVTPEPGEGDFKYTGGGSTNVGDTLTGFSYPGKRHLLKATIFQPAFIRLRHEYATNGLFNLSLTVANKRIAGTQTASADITIGDGIDNIILNTSDCFQTSTLVTVEILPHEGDDVKYTWDWGDGSPIEPDLTGLSNTHTYGSPNVYNVTVTAKNLLTEKVNTTEVCVQNIVQTPVIAADASQTSTPANFTFTVSSGSDYTCDWSTDSTTFTTTSVDQPSNSIVQHTYNTPGYYTVNITCHNRINSESFNILHIVEDAITGLALTTTGASKGVDFQLEWSIVTGSDPIFTATIGSRTANFLSFNVFTKVALSSMINNVDDTGLVLVSILATNRVSSVSLQKNISIEVPIRDVTFNCSPTEVLQSDTVTFKVAVEDGSGVQVQWDFDDGGATDTTSYASGETWPAGYTYQTQHAFSTGGTKTVTLEVSNTVGPTISHQCEIDVIAAIEGIFIVTNSPITFGPPGMMEMHFDMLNGSAPASAEVSIDFGDGSELVKDTPFQLLKTYTHEYVADGQYKVRAQISNSADTGVALADVEVIEPVFNFIVETNPTHASIGQDVEIKAIMYRGCQSGVILHWDFGDTQTAVSPESGVCPDGVTSQVHRYLAIQSQTIIITAQNKLGNTTAEYVIYTQEPVSRSVFDVTVTGSDTWTASSVRKSFAVKKLIPGDPMPTDASIIFDFGDGDSATFPLPAVLPQTFDHDYSGPGNYLAKVTIENLASSEVYDVEVGVFETITGLAVDVSFSPYKPLNSPDMPGYGAGGDIFPLDREVQFDVTMATGTVVQYDFQAVSPTQTYNAIFSSSPFKFLFGKVENYTVTVLAVNSVQTETVNTNVKMRSSNIGLKINDYGTVTASSEKKSFDVTMTSVGSDSCLVVNFGDGSDIEAFGDTGLCNPPSSHVGALFKGPFGNSNTIDHTYWKIGTYTITATATNILSEAVFQLTFPVSYIVCRSPAIDIEDREPEFTKPRSVKRSQIFRVIGTTDLNCTKTFENTKQWQVWLVNASDDKVIAEVDVRSLESSTKAELAVPANFLRYGLYKIRYTVKMDGDVIPPNTHFAGHADTYLKVDKTDLIVNMIEGGMTMIKIQRGTQLTLDPGSFSMDPDVNAGEPQVFDKYVWFCRKIGDRGYPTLPDGSYNVSFSSLPLTDPTAYTTDQGGCFRQGPGPLGFDQKTISINTIQFDVDKTYELMVIVDKDTREGKATLQVEVTDKPIPSIAIECKTSDLCQQAVGGQRVNPSARLALKGRCTSACSTEVKYKWEGFSYDYRWPYKPIPDFEIYTSGVEGVGSPEIAINNSLFDAYGNVSRFRIDLSVWEDGGEPGKSQIVLFVNRPPENGSCTLTGNTGEVLSSSVTLLDCPGYQDEDGVLTYQFFVTFKDEQIERHLVFGKDFKAEVQLPLGPDWDDFMMDVRARIYDGEGAFTSVLIDRVQVKPSSTVILKDWVDDLVTGTNDLISLTVAKAHLLESCFTFQSIGSAINSASKESVSEYANTTVSAKKTPSGYGPGEVTKSHDESMSPELERIAAEEKDDRAKLRAQMIAGIQKVTTSTVASVALKASTVTTLGAYPDELSRQAQTDMKNVLVDCAKSLAELAPVTTKEELIAAATNILAGAGTLLVASRYHYDDPLISDLAEAESQDVYDTNLESPEEEITNLNPVKGREQLTFGTNKNLQKETADEVVQDILDGVKEVAKAMRLYLVPGEEPVQIVTDQLALTLEKNHASQLANRTVDDGRGTSIKLPDWCTLLATPDCSTDETFNLEIITTPSVPFGLTAGATNLSFSNAIEINFIDDQGRQVGISNSQEDIAIIIPRDKAIDQDVAMGAEPVIIATRYWDYLYFHRSELEAKDSSIHVQFRPDDPNVQYLVFVRFDDFPNVTKHEWDFLQPIPHDMSQAGIYGSDSMADPYTMFISNDKIPAEWTGTFYVGIRQLVPDEYDSYSPNSNVTTANWKGGANTFTANYSVTIFTSSCVYFDEQQNDWSTAGCKVGELTSFTQTQCFCNHLTTFAGGLIVAPNKIDWAFVLNNADFAKNLTLFITEIVVFVVYVLAMIWARRKDKKDLQEVGIAPLPDNDAQDKYYYEAVVQTGMRSNAGTDSKVHFILSGEYEETDVRVLGDAKRKILRRGATDGFLIAVPRPLGPLNFLRIWHDNSGKGKFGSWYMKYLMLRDLQTGEKFYFICNKWFAVEEGDGQVDRVCPVAGPEQMMQFGHQFSQKTRRNLSDGHLWFSVVARPPRSRFTRVQRVSCCLCLLFLTMLANAMYYNTDEATSAGSFTFGPFALSPAQLYIGVVTNLIVFPVSFLIITLFRRSRPRKKRPSRIKEAIQKSGVKLSDINPEMGSKWSLKQEQLNLPDRDNPELRDAPTPRPGTAVSTISDFRSETSMSGKMTNSYYQMQKQKRDKAKTKRMLPWWCQIVAWILLFISLAASVTFVTFYGIQFGDYKCQKWITSMLVAFITSIFITQPIKVFLTAVFLSLIIRNPGEDDDEGDEDEEDPSLGPDEEYLHLPHANEGYSRPKKVAYKPPDPSILEKARELRLKEIKMWNVIREIVFYSFFLWILMVISYGNRDPLSYLYKFSLERNFIGNNVTSYDFRQVHNTKNFWNWTTRSLVPSIRAGTYYNKDPPLYLRGYINDKASRIMGYATMRQLRISKGTCRMEAVFEKVIDSCNGNYLFWNEEKESFKQGWQPLNESDPDPDPKSRYTYRSASSLNGYPYWGRLAVYNGGGYVIELRESQADLMTKMNELESEGWIDKYTRAIFIEFTVYNPGINLFAVSTLLAEWHPSAGVVASYRFEPVRLFSYMQSAILFQIMCEIAFVLFIIFFIYREVRSILKEKGKYLQNFWNFIEISIIGVSITAVVIYFYRLVVSSQLTNVFKESHGNDYMKFQYVGYWNEMLSYMIGWLVFLATFKFLKLLRFNRRMSLLAATLRNGWKSMFHFGIVFTIVFLAFIQLFYLVYHTNIYTFANFVNSMEAGFLMMMGKFDINSMMMMEPFITPVFFFLFVVTITFILVNMFVSILNESFSSVKHDVTKQPNEHEIVDFMLGRFKMWTGLGGAPQPTTKTPDMMMNNLKGGEYGNGKPPIEHFPDKVDELLNTISKAYFDQDNLENVLGPKTDADRMAMKNLLKKHAEATDKAALNSTQTDKVENLDKTSGHYRRF